MTDQPLDPQQYWQIQLPIEQFPKSKFQFNDQVALYWEDDQGRHHCEIGKIIGMEYIAQINQSAQWYYRIRYLKCDHSPWLIGTYDDCYEPESHFIADDTVIEN